MSRVHHDDRLDVDLWIGGSSQIVRSVSEVVERLDLLNEHGVRQRLGHLESRSHESDDLPSGGFLGSAHAQCQFVRRRSLCRRVRRASFGTVFGRGAEGYERLSCVGVHLEV